MSFVKPHRVFEVQNVSLNTRISSVNLQIESGQCWHFLGPNGAGKSSLLLLLAGVEKASSGVLDCCGMEMSEHSLSQLAKTRCFLNQHQHCEFDIPLSQLLMFYAQRAEVPALLDTCLEINKYLHKPLSQLSGGQQQRFHIARALCQIWTAICAGQAIVILDEPTSHLDIKFQTAIMALLQNLCESGNTVIISSHDINLSIKYASHVGLVNKQKLHSQGFAQSQLNLINLQTIFNHKFIEISSAEQSHKYIVSSSNQSI